MNQEMKSYLSTIKGEIYNLSKYLYDNPEQSFCEYKACKYIMKLLKDKNFRVKENYLDIPTAFYAEFGSGHPKLCFICEYDAASKSGHITGHNLISAMSISSALSLTKVLNKFQSGTIILLGCPGEFVSGSKITMAKQGTFTDIDVVLMAHPDIENAGTGSSMAQLPIKIKYLSKEFITYLKKDEYSSSDAAIFTLNAISTLKTGFKRNCAIDGIRIKNGDSRHIQSKESEIKFYIRTSKMIEACEIEKKIKELVKVTAYLMNVNYEITMDELPYDEIIPNQALSRIFAHNLKEAGIIDTLEPKNTLAGLSLGTVSHLVPCIQPYISIIDNSTIKYSTTNFAEATISEFAQDKILKAASALAMTGLDLLESQELLREIKAEFFESVKEHKDKPCIV
ncbi:M20 family peptidase [Candidatus Clostridium stratigraminis]|uniref:Peptidase M20 domain-containing protein 2 n=1 Tax=Candidatus Clostridium stratigraminis TaxID=3381661 RepID=A0ABW8T6R0_9CLOT